ncbi:MAG: hypothetical protein KDJ26_07385 [Alphaproteobacteria bacterium]|nr:hypothetical protein [Alphaproteobacteria bacterium]MCB1551804.1 hypothetical protein [Alphaproteobacteria bacterium]MCB9984128.1 hypothetical protein [Micavibrio sp.]HPQ50747.1 hypothetical protein [Alphaproteobacteria bacterium]HRK96975.1 hypothetical protein [Alphaproteobacteria bacterium]
MSNLHKHFGWAVLASELSHVFCCVLPTLVTVLGVLSNIGLIGAAPGFILDLHKTIHAYEIPIIVFSGVMVALGWSVHLASREVDCHNTGCVHPPCSGKKSGNSKILIIASLLFLANLVIYFGIHQNLLDLELFSVAQQHHDH